MATSAVAGHRDESEPPRIQRATLAAPVDQHIPGTTPAEMAAGISRLLYESAPVVVVAAVDDAAAQGLAIGASKRLHGPALLDGPGIAAEIKRLGARRIVIIGNAQLARAGKTTITRLRAQVTDVDAGLDKLLAANPTGRPTGPPTTSPASEATFILATRSLQTDAVAIANATQVGATVVEIPTSDPRTTPAAAAALREHKDLPVVALGDSFTPDFDYTSAVVQNAPELPGGGHILFPNRQLVALYGYPGTDALGVLGEQGIQASIKRAKDLAKRYQALTKMPVVPTFEMIATVASAEAGKDKDYSREASVAKLKPWVDAAAQAGVYVVLDLQPGRTDFLTQAKRYESLLMKPNVGLALDPEWRLKKKQKHLRQIGSVKINEVNEVAAWLGDLTRKNTLPQKAFVLHQFQLQMIRGRSKLDMSHPELSMVIHFDGQGTQPEKRATWKALHKGAPTGMFWGWKNFYDEDKPMLTIKKTVNGVRPGPQFVSYQ